MRTTTQRCLLLFSIVTLAAMSARADIILNPQNTNPTQRILSFKDFDDIRIDTDLDGIVDEWYLRKGKTQIRITYSNSAIDTVSFAHIRDQKYYFKKFYRSGEKLVLSNNIVRSTVVMFGSSDDENCDNPRTLGNKVSQLQQDLLVITSPVSPTCTFPNLPDFNKKFTSSVMKVSAKSAKITKCFGLALKGTKFSSELITSRLTLNYSKLSTNESRNLISCEASNTRQFQGITSEDGTIKFVIPKDGKDPIASEDAMRSLLHHELLHASGIKDETWNKYLIDKCVLNKSLVDAPSEANTFADEMVEESAKKDAKNRSAVTADKSKTTVTTRKVDTKNKTVERGIASAAAKSGDGVDMKSEIANAEAVIPSAEKLAVTKVDKSPAGKEQALRESVQDSAPVFRMANQVMGASNTPALADTSSSSEVASNSSNRSRYQSRHGRYQSDSSSGGGIGKDEFIAEEIDLTKNQNGRNDRSRQNNSRSSQRSYQVETPATASSQSENANSRGPASVSNEIGGAGGRRTGAVDGGGDAAVGGSMGSASLSMDTSSVGSGGGGGSASSRNTQKSRAANSASRAPASAGNKGSTAERRELMSSLVDSDYTLTRRKLKDPGFQTELSDNQITVIDVNGNRWGANQGAVIYLDDGNRFIRQR